jgi:hypothetical protein
LILAAAGLGSQESIVIGSSIMLFGVVVLVIAKFHYLYKFTKEHNAKLEGGSK